MLFYRGVVEDGRVKAQTSQAVLGVSWRSEDMRKQSLDPGVLLY